MKKKYNYRLKTVDYESGRKSYYAYVKVLFGWSPLNSKGQIINYAQHYVDRNNALDAIDLHYNGNNKIVDVEIVYVDAKTKSTSYERF